MRCALAPVNLECAVYAHLIGTTGAFGLSVFADDIVRQPLFSLFAVAFVASRCDFLSLVEDDPERVPTSPSTQVKSDTFGVTRHALCYLLSDSLFDFQPGPIFSLVQQKSQVLTFWVVTSISTAMQVAMAKTRHFQRRMSQRGISLEMVELARRFGEPNQDKTILGRKNLNQLLEALRELERTDKKALDKGGIVVVEDGEALITTYDFDSFDRRKAQARKGRLQ